FGKGCGGCAVKGLPSASSVGKSEGSGVVTAMDFSGPCAISQFPSSRPPHTEAPAASSKTAMIKRQGISDVSVESGAIRWAGCALLKEKSRHCSEMSALLL